MDWTAAQRIQGHRWTRRAAWAAGATLALWGLGWLALPPLLKSQVETRASAALGRQVSIGAVDFKPWSLELTVSDLAMASADGAFVQLGVKRLYADVELQSLLRFAPVVDAVSVDEPLLRLTHLGGGRYDIDDVLQKLVQPAGEPARFALYNLALRGGAVDFSDSTVNRTHAVRDLSLTVPFLSNLASQREVKVRPHLAFSLNGGRFDSSAEATPFAQTRKTDASFKISGLDLAPYLGYVPASVPLRLRSALLDADLKLAFAQTPQAAVRLSGTLQARGVKLVDARQQELLDFETLTLTLEDVRPLEQVVRLSAVELMAPRLAVRRDKAGRLNLALAAAHPGGARASASPQSAIAASGPEGAAASPASRPWQLAVARVAVRDGQLHWTDDTTAAGKTAAARLSLQGLTLDAADMTLPLAKPMSFKGAAALAEASGATLQFSGTATDRAASVTASVGALPLSVAAPYVAQFLVPTLSGTLHAALGLSWQAAGGKGRGAQLQLKLDRLSLDELALSQGKATLASIQGLALADARIDLGARSAALGRLAVTQPRLKVTRGTDRRWMFETWLRPGGAGAAQTAPKAGGAAAPGWMLAIEELLLSGGSVGWLDRATPRPVAFEVSALQLQLKGLDQGGRKPALLQLSARVGAGRTEPGRLAYRGSLGLKPLSTQGSLELVHLPVHAVEPYFGEALNIELLRADASFKGQLRYADSAAGPRVRLTGDGAVEEFRANSVPGSPAASGPAAAGTAGAAVAPVAGGGSRQAAGLRVGEELLAWKALSLRGLEVSLAPGAATSVGVNETALSDFFARVIIHESGRINLQDLVKSVDGAGPAAAGGTSGPAPLIRFGPVSLLDGKVFFSDRFIQPNYSANLSELTGKVGAFSSQSPEGAPQLADLELRGRAEGTASLEILGKLNPLAKPLALDIQGKLRDLELPPLSPYSVKYAGHGIERGKLSLDVAYAVLPNGQLTASNKLVLNQLSFGDKVEGASASLPVKLAVALLADRNGVIDINLPISGSLNDPQFRLGPVIVKVIVNLIAKAITSPFSLLAGALGGGGDELGTVSFAPGSAVLSAEARQNLDKVAQALTDRPALRMTVVGTASLEAEREGYRRERLRALVLAEKRRAVLASGAPAASVAVADAEYPALLKQVYQRADLPKPRNLIGLAKDIPQAEMEALLLAHIPATEDLLREVALQRGVAVRDYLMSRALPVERLFLGAARTVAPEPKWRPRAELNLTTR